MIQANLESNLNYAIMSFILQCTATRSFELMEKFGLDFQALGLFSEFSGEELIELTYSARGIFKVDVEINQEALESAIDKMSHRNSSLRNAMIKAKAPRSLVTRWWPMRHSEFAMFRKALNVECIGRAPKASELQEQQIWNVWIHLTRDKTLSELKPSDFLMLHQVTGVSLNVCWALIHDWANNNRYGSNHNLISG